nr:flagellar protein [Rhizobium sp. Q54]
MTANKPFLTISRPAVQRLLLLGTLLLVVPQVNAQEPVTVSSTSTQDEIRQFCTNIADAAKDQRYLLQKQELEKLQSDVDERIAVLENRKAEYEDWLKRRNDFLVRAEAGLVEIFKTMKADAAAPQLEEMNLEVAAAIIMKLPARQSGLVLSEMDPQKAGMIATIIASASDPNTSKEPS